MCEKINNTQIEISNAQHVQNTNNNFQPSILEISFDKDRFVSEMKQVIIDDDDIRKYYPMIMAINWKFIAKLCEPHFLSFVNYLADNLIIINSDNKDNYWIPVDEVINIWFPHFESCLDEDNDVIDEVFPIYETMKEIFVRCVNYNTIQVNNN